MNEAIFRILMSMLVSSVKNEKKKAGVKRYAKEGVQAIILAYSDDPHFLDDDDDDVV